MGRERRRENFVNKKRLNIVARSVAAMSLAAGGIVAVEKSGVFDPLASSIDSANHLVLDVPHKAYEQLISMLPETEKAEAADPIICCDGKTITFAPSGPVTEDDVQYIHDVVLSLVNNSSHFREYTGQSTHDNIQVIVTTNEMPLLGGEALPNLGIVRIDIGDNEVIRSYLVGDLSEDDKDTVYFTIDDETLAHEFGHLDGTQDPQLKENAVLNDINAGWNRLDYYGICFPNGHVAVPLSVDDYSGYVDVTAWYAGRRAAGGDWPPANSCSVGGVAELPYLDKLPQEIGSQKSEDNTIPIAAGVAGALATILTAAGAVLYTRRNRSAK